MNSASSRPSMSRPTERIAFISIALLALAGACGDDPPDDRPDANTIDAAPPADALTFDTNPYGIAFTEVTYELGTGFAGGGGEARGLGMGTGAAVADIDDDGDMDIFLARCDAGTEPAGPSLLLRNMGADAGAAFPTFVSDPLVEFEFAGACAHGASFGDYDGDGAVDLFVVLRGSDRLLKNDGLGVFTDTTAAAGVAGPAIDLNAGAYWVDINHDGLLDLYVLHHVIGEPGPDPLNANRLHINRGDGTFIEVAQTAGVAGDGATWAAAFADLDDDGDLEIYLANDQFAVGGQDPGFGLDADRLLDVQSYDDTGVPVYVDRAPDHGMDTPRSSMGVAIGDVDRDGRDDIYVTDIGANHLQIWNAETQTYEQREFELGLALRDALLEGELVGWDADFADLDRDGRLELMVVHGSIGLPRSCADYTQFDSIMRYEPTLARYFDIASDVGLPFSASCPPQDDRPLSGRGVVFADLDGDHDDDMIVTPYHERYRFYRNDTPTAERHALRVRPVGTVSASTPVGAVLEVERADGSTVRDTFYAGGTSAQRVALLEAGLDDQTTLTSATLVWPSGYRQSLHAHADFAIDTTWTVTEPAWLALSRRVVASTEDPPVLTYRPVDETGAFIGADAAGRSVVITRSDGVPASVTDQGDGSYTAILDHPGAARITTLTISDQGSVLRPRPSLNYR